MINQENKLFFHWTKISVGGEELIGAKDYISMDSHMAQALLKKEVGDEAIVKTATRQFVWRIICSRDFNE